MLRTAATLSGYMNVARAGEVLHLAPRSVRDLIYAGRLPSQRVGRRHYLRASDVEQEHRRRLGKPLLRRAAVFRPTPRRLTSPSPQSHVDPEVRRQRALERNAQIASWTKRQPAFGTSVPFNEEAAPEAFKCAVCSRLIRAGRCLRASPGGDRLCLGCGRRAVLEWADRRRFEASSARRLARDLGTTLSENSMRAA